MAARKPFVCSFGTTKVWAIWPAEADGTICTWLGIGQVIGEVAAGEIDDEAARQRDRPGRASRSRAAGAWKVFTTLPPGCMSSVAETARMR